MNDRLTNTRQPGDLIMLDPRLENIIVYANPTMISPIGFIIYEPLICLGIALHDMLSPDNVFWYYVVTSHGSGWTFFRDLEKSVRCL